MIPPPYQTPDKKPRKWLLWGGLAIGVCCCGCPGLGIIRAAMMTPEERAAIVAKAQADAAEKPTPKVATPKGQKAKPASAPKEDLEVFDVKSSSGDYVGYATGKVRNNTDHKYSYVQVEINLLDKEGNLVGSTLANVNNLDPGKVWVFKAPVMEKAARRFEVKDVTGY